ncbi:MAG: hypothetical protein EB121_06150 [Alphaproteobacteria bacterium]|nr:hypothetical protein [Alphaproteobacteria bacterium]
MNASAKGVLLTRPMPAAASTIDALKQRGFVVYHQPLLHLAPTHAPRPEGVRADAIIITSQNSFCFWHPPHDLCEVPCYIVGQKTAEALVRGLSAIHQQQQCRGMMAFCLSPAVARAAGVLAWQKVLTPAQPEEEKLLQLLHHTLSETP